MLSAIIDFSVRNKLVIGLFILALIGWGSYEVTRLPIDAVPDITDNQVQVITISPALGAEDVERLITFPIEQVCSNIPGLKNIRSFSRFGLSLVTIVLEDEVDIYWARQQISERLLQVRENIPSGIGFPEMAPVTTGLGEIYQYVVRPLPGFEGKYDAMALRTIQDGIVRRQLLGTPGVADVSSFGGQLKQYEIAVNTSRLKAHGLTIAEIFDALARNNENTGGAYIEKGPTVLYIRTDGLTRNIQDIEKIVIKVLSSGIPVLMKDVATVQLGYATRYGAMCFNDQGEVAGAVVMMLKGENSSVVIRRVKEKVAQIQKSLPQGVVIEPFLDRTKMVSNAIDTVQTNLLEGALIVVFVLVFFLGNLRGGLIVSSVIPLSMLFAIILMNMFGVGGNLMSLGAIDFGLIVDGSVIVVEAILHRFSHSRHFAKMRSMGQAEMDKEVSASTGAMIKSAVFSQIIILIVYIPILSLEGIEGKMFKPMAYTVAFAILGAFILSVTYVPMVSALFLSKKISHTKTLADKIVAWLERKYQPLLSKVLRIPKLTLATTLAFFIVAVTALLGMGGEFIPELEEGDFAVETRLLTGSSLTTTIATTQKTAAILLKKFPEVEKVVTKIGSSEIPTDPMPLEASDMMVILKDKSEWTSAGSFDELAEKMGRELSVVPGVSIGFQFPVQMRFNELMTGARQDVVCKIFGEDLDTLALYSQRLGQIISTVQGSVNLYVETVTGMPQVVIKYNRDAMALYGLNVSDINKTVNTAFAGQSAGMVYEGEKRFDLVVRLEQEARKNISDIENLLVPTPAGLQIPLYQVASIQAIEGPNQIQRENTRRRIIVGFNVSGRDVQSIVTELQEKVSASLKLPPGYTVTYGGAFENLNGAKARLSIVVPIALVLIFLMLYFAFQSVSQGLLIYSAIPLSAVGGIFSLWLRDMPFSISAGVGFIALFGVAVLNGILLVSEFNRLKKEGWTDSGRIVVHATKAKLRAILMTALVPSLGFIPMAFSRGAGAEVQKPLATVVIGGLIFSTLLTLFVLPVLYTLIEGGLPKMKPRVAVILIMLFMFTGFAGMAQEKISLDEALSLALKNNPDGQVARLTEAYNQELKKTGFELDKTTLGFEYGQMNSVAKDTKFSLSQTIQFPGVYNRERQVLASRYTLSQLATKLTEAELRKEVKSLFFELIIMDEREKLLQQAAEMYASFLDRAQQRFALGDADVLEKSTATNQALQIQSQLHQLVTDKQAKLRELSRLLNIEKEVRPVANEPIYRGEVVAEMDILNSPRLQWQQEQVNLSQRAHKLEKSKLFPWLNLGYNNLSIIGFQKINETERYFQRSNRFSYVSLGLGVPIFQGAQRARIKASAIEVQIRETARFASQQQLSVQLENAHRYLEEYRHQVQVYQSTLLPNAVTILESASNRLRAGEIGYLDWVMLSSQAFSIQSEYLNILQHHNEMVLAIEQWQGQ